MKTYKVALTGILAAIAAFGQTVPAQNELLNAVREGDRSRVAALLRSGIDPNTRDEAGSTALMHAAAFGSLDILRLLLEAGANPKTANATGSTPLMWATHEPARVRLLLAAGADINASRSDGVTPLVTAALRGNTEVVRILLSAGADAGKGSALAPFPMSLSGIAYSTNDNTLRDLLVARTGRAPQVSATTATAQPAAPPPFSNWLLTATFSWRPQPSSSSASLVKALLDRGADPNETVAQLTLTTSALARVAQLGDAEASRLLLDRGADPNTKGSSGWTPLMAATVAEKSTATVKVLLEKGARVNERDDAGRTALDWALLKGESDTSRLLRRAGAVAMAPPPPAPAAVTSPRTARTAVELALARLLPASKTFKENRPCISCHHQSLPAVAVKLALDKGVQVDPEMAKLPTVETLKLWNQARENLLVGNCSVFGFIQNVTYGMLGLAEEGVPPSPATDAVTSCLAGLQNPDGSWEGNDARPPLSGRTPLVYTALTVRGLKTYAQAGRRNDTEARIARARNYLRRAVAEGVQDEAFKLLGLIWTAAPSGEIAAQAKRLLSLQRADGGWSQYPSMASDAYATGQALYALRASGIAATSAEYRKAADYLRRTQLEDGTWYMGSRAMGFQPYVESGFPHGKDQFISAAATSWAAIALAYTL